MTDYSKSPIIILGMHRSGTSLICRKLESLGLNVGNSKDPNHEASTFQNLNKWLLYSTGATWYNPMPVTHLLANEEVFYLSTDYVRHRLSTINSYSFLGFKKTIKYKNLLNVDEPWGWKDPQTTLLLPIWLKIYPSAKIIYVDRDNMDVSMSLHTRAKKNLSEAAAKHNKRKKLGVLYKKKGLFSTAVRALDIVECMRLVKEYKDFAKLHLQKTDCEIFHINYENFLNNPMTTLKELSAFCGLSVDANTIADVSQGIDGSRAHAYLNDPELVSLSQEHSDLLRRDWPNMDGNYRD